jgi:alpha-1,3-mannosyl-glycoprotein beta-1,2-N-acetylglucosaminyltransferase
MAGRRIRPSSQMRGGTRSLEQKALLAMLLMAWGWIVGFFIVVVLNYRTNHGGLSFGSDGSPKHGIIVSNSILQDNTPKLRPQQSEPSKSSQPFNHINSHPADPNIPSYKSPLLIFTCNRANYLQKTLEEIFKYLPSKDGKPCQFGCPIVISQDGDNHEVQKVIEHYKTKFEGKNIPLVHLQHTQNLRGARRSSTSSYLALAQHYGWALRSLFSGDALSSEQLPIPDRVIILEEDIQIAPDFFDYFQATSDLLDQDPSLFAVSAFNDNGHLVKDPTRLLRSDFFPGLGWMMTRKLWKGELEQKWPSGYWDDWLREPAQRQNRQVIRPEISRTYHFGNKGGASNNQFGSILERVKLNTEPIQWNMMDLGYLRRDKYNQQYGRRIISAHAADTIDEALAKVDIANVRLPYKNFKDFQRLARHIGIMDDEKAMVPRTSYLGVVETRPTNGNILFLVPPADELRNNFPDM